MKSNIMLKYGAVCLTLLTATACNDFLDTTPKDSLSQTTAWQTPDDVDKFLIGCYNGWIDDYHLMYFDCASDIAYNNFPWEGYTVMGNGSLTASNYGYSLYNFYTISQCNNVIDHIDQVTFSSQSVKDNMLGQAKTIRANKYFDMNFWYGGVPIVSAYTNANEAKIPRKTEAEVKQFIYDEIDEAITLLPNVPAQRGRIAKGTALAIKMRSALYWGDYQRAKDAAQAIIDLGVYELHPNYAEIFTVAGQGSKEIIAAAQFLTSQRTLYTVGQFYNNADGGWSSVVPTQKLVDMYEMADGKTITESSTYDATHPFAGRDPRMAMSILYPGQDWNGSVLNTLDETVNGSKNSNYPTAADNASKTALTWAKYLAPKSQYADMWATNACPILFRYAEVLLTYAEVENELNGPSADVYAKLDAVRTRAGMPAVDQSKYGTKETLRELIRRERCVELAGEGVRRADLVRWTDTSGQMLAMTAMNGNLTRIKGTVNMTGSDPYTRATVSGTEVIENRKFVKANRYLPIPQLAIDRNPQLTQNADY